MFVSFARLMSYLLLVDTSGENCTLAISADGDVLQEYTAVGMRNHAASLPGLLEKAFQFCKDNNQKISAVCICAGPGSYTGLRIGMSTAKALCFSLDIPLLAFNILNLRLNRTLTENKSYDSYLCIMKAREGEYFTAFSKNLKANQISTSIQTSAQLELLLKNNPNSCIISNGLEAALGTLALAQNSIIVETDMKVDFPHFAKEASRAFYNKHFVNVSAAVPLYIKEPHTTVSKQAAA